MLAPILLPPGALLEAARAFVPPDLVNRSAYRRVTDAVAGLPAAFSGFFVEVPLRAKGDRADILLGTLASSDGRAALARSSLWPAPLRANATWRGVLAFFRQWASGRQRQVRSIPLSLLELDLQPDLPSGVRVPGLHVCIAPAFASDGWEVPPRGPADPGARQLRRLIGHLLSLTAGAPPPRALLGVVARCRDALPPGGRLLHFSAMFSRPSTPYKLNVLIPRERLAGWLGAVGWPGRLPALTDLVARFGLGAPLVKLDVALQPEIEGATGFEVALPGNPRREPRWRVLFDALVADGLCTEAQARALAEWPAPTARSISKSGWPVLLDRSLTIKITTSQDGVAAKAYLGLTPWFSFPEPASLQALLPSRSRRGGSAPRGPLRLAPNLERKAARKVTGLSAALVSEAAREALARAAGALPDACTSWCLECRLAPGSEQVDLLACVSADGGGRAALAPSAQWPLSRVAGLVRRWKDRASPLHTAVPFIWFELDLPTGQAALPAPCLYVGLAPRPISFPGGRLHPRRRTGRALRAIIAASAAAAQASIPPGAARTAVRVVAALPPGAQLNCLGFMLARPDSPLRLSLELPPGELESYLGAIGWKGGAGDLGLVQALLAHGVDRLALAIDAGPEVGSRLGIELFYHRPPSVDRRFGAVLDDLESRGLCAPAKAAALRRWRGAIHVPGGRLERTVYHVKIVLDSATRPFAKSYLWLATAELRQRPVD